MENEVDIKEKKIKTIEESFAKTNQEKEALKMKVIDLEKKSELLETTFQEEIKVLKEEKRSLEIKEMLFDLFKIEMRERYGHEEETEDENANEENSQVDFTRSLACGKCNFVGKTEPGLKTHVRAKHKESDIK